MTPVCRYCFDRPGGCLACSNLANAKRHAEGERAEVIAFLKQHPHGAEVRPERFTMELLADAIRYGRESAARKLRETGATEPEAGESRFTMLEV